ncbi:hypothetical protein [Algisphaera agarilytica]|uniref:Uncharacterized protein n=1 Tax=Algisphaera agarilytica TaxID=1385975 RepID=A0A7X0H715_9BACT|nr:hypothetical protein [Algisphaera agarilytica]MBB6428980.1 hypothetical protein [Algisphaera agarilytica]
MSKPYLPARESELVTWTQGFASLIEANPTTYGLTADQATGYGALRAVFITAYDTANEQTTRSPANIEAKNTLKRQLIAETRKLVRIIQASPAINNDKRAALGITVPDTDPTPVPPPEDAPQLDIVSVEGRTVKLRLRNAATGKRKKPEGVATATVLSYVGEDIPADIRDWSFEGNDTRLDTEVEFGDEFTPATKVWLTAFWSNRRGESGPACAPISTHLGFGVTANPGSASGSSASDQADAA